MKLPAYIVVSSNKSPRLRILITHVSGFGEHASDFSDLYIVVSDQYAKHMAWILQEKLVNPFFVTFCAFIRTTVGLSMMPMGIYAVNRKRSKANAVFDAQLQ